MNEVSQSIISLLEGYIISGSWNNALLYGGSTYLSTLVTRFTGPDDSIYNKEFIEPIRAGLLAMAGKYVFGSHLVKDPSKYKYLKTAGLSFIITGSSAGLNQLVTGKKMGGNSYSQAEKVLAALKESKQKQTEEVAISIPPVLSQQNFGNEIQVIQNGEPEIVQSEKYPDEKEPTDIWSYIGNLLLKSGNTFAVILFGNMIFLKQYYYGIVNERFYVDLPNAEYVTFNEDLYFNENVGMLQRYRMI